MTNTWIATRRGRESSTAALPLALLVALLLVVQSPSALAVDIYISPTGGWFFGGGCQQNACTQTKPCKFEPNTDTYSTWAVECNITILNGDYSSTSPVGWYSRVSQLVTVILGDDVRNLDFNISSVGPILFTPSSPPTRASLTRSTIRYLIRSPSETAMSATMRGVNFTDSRFYSGGKHDYFGPSPLNVTVADCNFESSQGSPYALALHNRAEQSSLVVDNTQFHLQAPTTAVSLSPEHPSTTVVIRNSLLVAQSAPIGGLKAETLQLTNNNFTVTLPNSQPIVPSLFNFGGITNDSDTYTISKCDISVTNEGVGGKPQLFPVMTSLPLLSISESALSGFVLDTSPAQSSAGMITISNSTIFGGAEFTLSLPFSVSDTYVDLSQPGSCFRMASSTLITGHTPNLTIFSGSETPSKPTFGGKVTLDSGSTLTIDKLFLDGGSTITVPSLNVTTLVSGDAINPSEIACSTARSKPTDGHWGATSIKLQNAVNFNVTNVGVLEYRATSEAVGIVSESGAHVTGVPEMISVLWRPDSEAVPIPGTRYPVMQSGTAQPGTQVPEYNDPVQSVYTFKLEYSNPSQISFYLASEPTEPVSPPPPVNPPPISPPITIPPPLYPITPPAEIIEPSSPPIDEPESPPIDEPIGNYPPPIACPTPGPIGFACENGLYVAHGDISQTSLEIPPKLGTVTVIGNLSTPQGIVFHGSGTSLNVTGCIQSPDGVTFDFSKEDPKKVTTDAKPIVLTQSAGCTNSLAAILVTNAKTKDCNKVKATKSDASTPSTLVVLLTLDNSKCKTKWIILGATLGTVFVLGVIIALMFTFHRGLRREARPYAK